MAKCAICKSKKGQRRCGMVNSMVCSLCCGENRKMETCQGCDYFREVKPTRNYREVPRFSPGQMDHDLALQGYSNTIESTLCLWDRSMDGKLKDEHAIRVLELLLDKYYFRDEEMAITDETLRKGFDMAADSIAQDLSDLSHEVLNKVIGVIHFVARRRSRGGREYFDVIHQYVGLHIGPGVRALSMDRGKI